MPIWCGSRFEGMLVWLVRGPETSRVMMQSGGRGGGGGGGYRQKAVSKNQSDRSDRFLSKQCSFLLL